MKENRKFSPRDLAIGAAAALLICFLVLLFLRRDQPLRHLVFGDLAPASSTAPSTDSHAVHNTEVVRNTSVGSGRVVSRPDVSGPSVGVPVGSGTAGGVGGETAPPVNASVPTGLAGDTPVVPPPSTVSPETGLPLQNSAVGAGSSISPPNRSAAGNATGAADTPHTTRSDSAGPAASAAAGTGDGQSPPPGTAGGAASSSSIPASPNSASASAGSGPTTTPRATASSSGSFSTTPSASASSSDAARSQNRSPGGAAASAGSSSSSASAPAQSPRPGTAAAAASPSRTDSSTATDSVAVVPDDSKSVASAGADELLQLAKNEKQMPNAGGKSTADALQAATLGAGQNPPSTSQLAASESATPGAGTSTSTSVGSGSSAGDQGGRSKSDPDKPIPENPVFGSQRGTNIVFVLDRSESMTGEKSRRARSELVDTLEHLAPDKSFYVIFFPLKTMPTAGPIPATSQNIRSVTNWIFSTGHALGSNPTKAVEKALEFKPDTVWLLSDGKFSSSVPRAIRTANDTVNAHIHTIGFYERDGEAVLRQIADENTGIYRFVGPLTLAPVSQ